MYIVNDHLTFSYFNVHNGCKFNHLEMTCLMLLFFTGCDQKVVKICRIMLSISWLPINHDINGYNSRNLAASKFHN